MAADERSTGFPPTAVVDLTIGRVEISIHGDVGSATLIAVAETVSTATGSPPG